MRYLLDTDIIVDHLRRKKPIREEILDNGVISIITLGELIYGAYKSIHPHKSLITLKNNLQLLELEVINLNEIILAEFGRVKADLENKGKRLDDFDLLIGSTAKNIQSYACHKKYKTFQAIEDLRLWEDNTN